MARPKKTKGDEGDEGGEVGEVEVLTTSTKASKGKKKEATGTSPLERGLAALDQIFKGYRGYQINLDHAALKESLPHISSGVTALDWKIGGQLNPEGISPCPGFPKGRIIQIWGAESAGKTTLALSCAREVVAKGGQVVFIDWEHAIDPHYSSRLVGINIGASNQFLWAQPDSLEEGLQIALTVATAGVDLIILDSVGAAILQAENEAAVSEFGGTKTAGAGIGAQARVWSMALPKLKKVLAQRGTTMVAISQTRSAMSMGGYGPKDSVQGGNAWKFFASLRIEVKRVKTLVRKTVNPLTHKSEETPFAIRVKATLRKSKVSGTAHQEVEYIIRNGYGIDNLWTLIEAAKANGIIKGTSWLTWVRADGSEFKQQGLERFRTALLEEPILKAEFEGVLHNLLFQDGESMVEEDSAEEMTREEILAALLADAQMGGDED